MLTFGTINLAELVATNPKANPRPWGARVRVVGHRHRIPLLSLLELAPPEVHRGQPEQRGENVPGLGNGVGEVGFGALQDLFRFSGGRDGVGGGWEGGLIEHFVIPGKEEGALAAEDNGREAAVLEGEKGRRGEGEKGRRGEEEKGRR